MANDATVRWYETFWSTFNLWLSEMAAKNIKRVYINNFEFIPENINKSVLADAFNKDSNSWRMVLDEDFDLVCIAK